MQASDIADGRWGITRIVQEADGGFTTAASQQQATLANTVKNYYPPNMNVGWAICNLIGVIGAPDVDTLLIPVEITDSVTLGDLTAGQRNNIRDAVKARFIDYAYTDRVLGPVVKQNIAATVDAYTLATPLKEVIADVLTFLSHSRTRV